MNARRLLAVLLALTLSTSMVPGVASALPGEEVADSAGGAGHGALADGSAGALSEEPIEADGNAQETAGNSSDASDAPLSEGDGSVVLDDGVYEASPLSDWDEDGELPVGLSDPDGEPVPVSSFDELKAALEDPENLLASEANPIVVEVAGSIAVTGELRIVGHVVLKAQSDSELQLRSTQQLTRDPGYTGYLLMVDEGASLVLEDIVIDGSKAAVTAENALIKVMWNGAKLTLGAGAVLQNNDVTGAADQTIDKSLQKGSGVFVQGGHMTYADGELVMNDGALITGMAGDTQRASNFEFNAAHAAVVTEGPFTMNGGEIRDNTVQGVMVNGYALYGNTFYSSTYPNGLLTMEGGEIAGNIVDGDGAGVHVNAATATINGGKIVDNEASGRGGGISVSTRVKIGVYSDSVYIGRLYTYGGEISGNSAAYGGGIGTLTAFGSGGGAGKPMASSGYNHMYLLGGAIANNTADHGGGVFNEITHLEIKNASITGNTAHGYGGGVLNQDGSWVYGSTYSWFVLENSIIKGNVAEGTLPSPHTDLGMTDSHDFTCGFYGNEIFKHGGYFWVSGNVEIGDPDLGGGIAVHAGDAVTNINSAGDPLTGAIYYEYIQTNNQVMPGGIHGKIFVQKDTLETWGYGDVTEDEIACFKMLPNSTYPNGLYPYYETYTTNDYTQPGYPEITIGVGVWAYEGPEVAEEHVVVSPTEAQGFEDLRASGDISGYADAVGAVNWQYGYHKDKDVEDPSEIDFASLALSTPYAGIGTYGLAFTTPNQGLEATAKLTVNDRDALEVDLTVGEAVAANSITISTADVKAFTADDYTREAQAVAWTTDGSNTALEATPSVSGIAAIPASAGIYYLSFTSPGGVETTIKVTVVDQESILSVARLFGPHRYATAAAVAAHGRAGESGGTVILASGADANFPDALAASSLSGAEGNAPIVLTDPNALSDDARSTILSLSPSKVIIIGSPNTVTSSVEAEVAAVVGAGSVERIGGATRQETADLIYGRLGPAASKTAIVALATDFPDSLSASSWAAHTKSPIFLAHFGGTGLSEKTKEALRTGGFERILVLGSERSVSAAVEAEARSLAGLPASSVVRLGGEDRYRTASLIAEWATSADRADHERLDFSSVAVARGDKHADALAGGALQGRDSSVILLTNPKSAYAPALSMVAGRSGEVGEIRFFGDENAVDVPVVRAFVKAVPYDSVAWKPSDEVAVPLD